MVSFRETREMLLIAHHLRTIDDEEFALLYDLNTSENKDYPYWSYPQFDVDEWTDAECVSELRFLKADVYRLAEVFRIPNELKTYNGSVFDGKEAFCVFLKRFAYPVDILTLFQDLVGLSPKYV